MRIYKGLHVFVFVWLVSCCVADWTPVKNSAEKAAEAQQVIQEQLNNYLNYMVSQTYKQNTCRHVYQSYMLHHRCTYFY